MTLGFVAALAIAFPALMLSAGGDGWNAPIQGSLGLLVVLPVLGASWAYRHQDLGRGLAILVLAAALLLDLHVAFATWGEFRYLRSAIDEAGKLVACWLVLWLAWQAAAVVHLLQFRQPGESVDEAGV